MTIYKIISTEIYPNRIWRRKPKYDQMRGFDPKTLSQATGSILKQFIWWLTVKTPQSNVFSSINSCLNQMQLIDKGNFPLSDRCGPHGLGAG